MEKNNVQQDLLQHFSLAPVCSETGAIIGQEPVDGPGYWPQPAWGGIENALAEGSIGMSLRGGSMMPKMEDIGIAAAIIKISRSFNVYLEILHLFVQNVEENIVLLETIPDRLNLPSFTIFMHGMKNALTTIGARALSELAGMLEAAGINGDISVIRDNLPLFRMGLAALTVRIDEATIALRSDVASSALLREGFEARDTDGTETALARLQSLLFMLKKQKTDIGTH